MRLVAVLSLLCAACSARPEEGSYRFHLLSLEEDTCGRAELLPSEWEGILRVHNVSIEVLLPDDFFLTAVGDRTLTGLIFDEQDPQSLLANASFSAEAPLHGRFCPAFVQSQLTAAYHRERFTGSYSQRFVTPPEAPEDCPVQCSTSFRFEAERFGPGTGLPIEP